MMLTNTNPKCRGIVRGEIGTFPSYFLTLLVSSVNSSQIFIWNQTISSANMFLFIGSLILSFTLLFLVYLYIMLSCWRPLEGIFLQNPSAAILKGKLCIQFKSYPPFDLGWVELIFAISQGLRVPSIASPITSTENLFFPSLCNWEYICWCL